MRVAMLVFLACLIMPAAAVGEEVCEKAPKLERRLIAAELDALQFHWDEPKSSTSAEEAADSDGVAGAMAAAAAAAAATDIASGVSMDFETQILGGVHVADNEAAGEDILNVEI